MAIEMSGYLKLKVRGGQEKQSHTVGLALGSKGLNIMDFCKQFNARSQEKMGQLLPVLVTIYADKSFDFDIKTHPGAVLIVESIKKKKGSPESNRDKIGSITWDQIKEIAEVKMPDLKAFKIESAMKMLAGTARSMGVRVQGEFPQTEIVQ